MYSRKRKKYWNYIEGFFIEHLLCLSGSQRGPQNINWYFIQKLFCPSYSALYSVLGCPCQTIIPRVEINCLMKPQHLYWEPRCGRWSIYCIFQLEKIMIKNMPSLSSPINYKKENYIRDRRQRTRPVLCRDYWRIIRIALLVEKRWRLYWRLSPQPTDYLNISNKLITNTEQARAVGGN